MTTFQRRFSTILVSALLVGLSGCATVTQEQLDQAMDMARQAQQEAAAARQAAGAAQNTAQEAQRAAQAARTAATAAQSAASEANSCCRANSEKIERSFRESMRK